MWRPVWRSDPRCVLRHFLGGEDVQLGDGREPVNAPHPVGGVRHAYSDGAKAVLYNSLP